MRANEFIAERINPANIDWERFRIALTAWASQSGLQNYQRIDGVVFLGIAGDPKIDSVIGLRDRKGARVGVTDLTDPTAHDAFHMGAGQQPGRTNMRINGEYFPYDHSYDRPGDRPGDRNIRNKYIAQYDIILNQDAFSVGNLEGSGPSTIAHEFRHRGMQIARQLPIVINGIPEPLKTWFVNNSLHSRDIPGLNLGPDRDFFEHLLIYAVQMTGDGGYDIGTTKDEMFRSKEELLQFRKWYLQIEKACRAYVLSYPVPPGGYESLRNYLNKITPDNIDIQVRPGPDGKPSISGVVEKIQGLINQVPPTAPPVDPVKKIQGLMKQPANQQ
jgi:hypothetical protein